MRTEIAHEWAEWLLSNEDVQGRGDLCADGKFCCLGILCELAIERGVGVVKEPSEYFFSGRLQAYDGHTGAPPDSVTEWVEASDAFPVFKENGRLYDLAELNDYSLLTFPQIAEKIIQHAEEL